jgi:hypothetical protein
MRGLTSEALRMFFGVSATYVLLHIIFIQGKEIPSRGALRRQIDLPFLPKSLHSKALCEFVL